MPLSEIEQDQADFVARLSAEPFFANVGIYELRPRANMAATTIMQGIEMALNGLKSKAGKSGVAVTVLMPLLQGRDPNVRGAQFDASITIRVQELPLTNMNPTTGTLKSAESVALEVVRLFHHFRGGSGQIWTVAQGGGVQPNLEFDPKVTYDVTVGRLMPTTAPAKVAPVVISPRDGGVAGRALLVTIPPGGVQELAGRYALASSGHWVRGADRFVSDTVGGWILENEPQAAQYFVGSSNEAAATPADVTNWTAEQLGYGSAPVVVLERPVTLTAPGASIYYTLDGSYPAPGGDASVLYAGPIEVPEACVLRAVAYATGKQASDVTRVVFTA